MKLHLHGRFSIALTLWHADNYNANYNLLPNIHRLLILKLAQ